ncbi:MAG: hypothetical protein ACRCZO_00590, partial [Cetobacterium sp.]
KGHTADRYTFVYLMCLKCCHEDVMHRQADITKLLEIPVFYGDPLQLELFIRASEHSIEGKTDNSQDRLYFLEQYTGGQPRELVRSCIHMNRVTRRLRGYYTNFLRCN